MTTLKGEAFAAFKSAGSSAALQNLLQIIQLIVLARLLAPSDFGLMAMVHVVVGFATIFLDVGLSNAVIQRREVSNEALSSLYWLNLLAGGIAAALVAATSPLVASFYRDARVKPLLLGVAAMLLVAPFGQLYNALLEKALQFDRIARIEVAAYTVGVVTAIVLAWRGAGVYALLLGLVTNQVLKTAFLVVDGARRWRPSPRFRKKDFEGLLSFGLHHVGQRTVNFLVGNIDYLLIGRFLGARELGFYSLAFNLASIPSTKINLVTSRVFFPVLARVQEEIGALRRAYYRMQQATALVSLPILAGMAAVAPVAIPLFLGERWRRAVILVQILAFVGATRAISGLVGPLILARGRTDLGFRWSLLIVVIQIPGIYFGALSGSAVGVAIAFALLQILFFAMSYWILVRTLIGPSFRDFRDSLATATMASLIMGVIVYLLGAALRNLNAAPLLAIQIATGILVYSAIVWLREREFVIETGAMILRRNANVY